MDQGKYWVHVSDPAEGLLKYHEEQFLQAWLHGDESAYCDISDSENMSSNISGDLNDSSDTSKTGDSYSGANNSVKSGVALLLEVTPAFYVKKGDEDKRFNIVEQNQL